MNARRALRITGTALAVAGALMLIWVVIVWRWHAGNEAEFATRVIAAIK